MRSLISTTISVLSLAAAIEAVAQSNIAIYYVSAIANLRLVCSLIRRKTLANLSNRVKVVVRLV
jgi:hypothetical protein